MAKLPWRCSFNMKERSKQPFTVQPHVTIIPGDTGLSTLRNKKLLSCAKKLKKIASPLPKLILVKLNNWKSVFLKEITVGFYFADIFISREQWKPDWKSRWFVTKGINYVMHKSWNQCNFIVGGNNYYCLLLT